MRVLQINSVCGVGSTGRIATDLHAILQDQGHESYIAYGRDTPINCDTTIKIGNKLDNYTHVAKTRIFDKHGFGSKRATKEFIDKIIELDPDVIHLHNIHGYYINVELLFAYLKKAGKPVVWTLHDCWAFTGHCAYFDFVGCNCWKNGSHKCIQKRSYPASLLINNSRQNFIRKKNAFTGIRNLTIVTPSKWLAGLVKESFLNEYPIKVINNGIDLEVFKPTKSKFKEENGIENKFIILGVASVWEKRKGYEYFIELSKKTNPNVIILLVGLTDDQIKQLPSNIIGIKRTNSIQELADIYSVADVFVNPTLEDNFPTTNLEALACGTPVITFDTGGSVESIDKFSGIVVPKGSIEKLVEAIEKTQKNKFNQLQIISRSRDFNKYDKYSQYIELY
ncbi:glycosyltransferase involved in cell wall biosynthesis [Neobacillus niacini]|uniref:glycosyltransferase n=1 Tax=Neobacillus niacini TaxID=86668 RepID=UPI002855FA1D|nr:glycosyltransferase [Neobacillus niacini]MDR7079581.1 glycosyltransferase involved in cell wall biosynthesis [Neobacillus niacini]